MRSKLKQNTAGCRLAWCLAQLRTCGSLWWEGMPLLYGCPTRQEDIQPSTYFKTRLHGYNTFHRCLSVRMQWLWHGKLTIWRPPLPYGTGTAMKHTVPDRVKQSFVIFDIRAFWRITNDGLTRSGTGCFIAV